MDLMASGESCGEREQLLPSLWLKSSPKVILNARVTKLKTA
jgi:hypothetical protein